MRVVICGGGVIGSCTAYFLVRRGIDVTVVERTKVAAAASGNPCMGLSLSSAKFATRYLSTCSGWFDVRGADLWYGLAPVFLSSFLPFLHGPFKKGLTSASLH